MAEWCCCSERADQPRVVAVGLHEQLEARTRTPPQEEEVPLSVDGIGLELSSKDDASRGSLPTQLPILTISSPPDMELQSPFGSEHLHPRSQKSTASHGERGSEEQLQSSFPKDDAQLPPSCNGKEGQAPTLQDVDIVLTERSAQDRSVESGHGASSAKRSKALAIWQAMADPQNFKRFLIDICVCEIIGKQIPLAFVLALPVMAMDVVIGRVIRPQNELSYVDNAHRSRHNASFNVHMDYNPGAGPRVPHALGSYMPCHFNFALSLTGWWTWLLMVIPYVACSKEEFAASTPRCFVLILAMDLVANVLLIWIGGDKAGKVDGPKVYAIVGSLSPAIPIVLILLALLYWRGRLMNKATDSKLWVIALVLNGIASITFCFEVIYILGLSGMPMERREFLAFLYRALVWPLIWFIGLLPLFRYVLFATEGPAESIIPYISFAMSMISLSSRALMYAVDNNTFFFMLALEDAVLQSILKLKVKHRPIDQIIVATLWKRCLGLRDIGEILQQDANRVIRMRMYWFQAQSIMELTVIVSQAVRVWALYESRHIFALMFRPDCEHLDSFDWETNLFKFVMSVFMLTTFDAGTSYLAYCKGYPLAEVFRTLFSSRISWLSFAFMNFCGFSQLIWNMQPIMGRLGRCTDFDDGCSCAGLAVYKEICGCCGLTSAAAAASNSAICRL